jgi:hypothetical protein
MQVLRFTELELELEAGVRNQGADEFFDLWAS